MPDLPAAILEPLRQWRQAHPRATWSEIEAEIDRQLHADLVTALAAPAAEALATPPACPSCQQAMRPCGQRPRQVQSQRGPLITIQREYDVCPACGTGLFPPG
jgi:hypothetical protein